MNRKVLFSISAVSGMINIIPMSAQTPKPNVVIIMTDQQRADLCGREGFPMAVTPFADSLALSNVWFDKAYTVAPASMPARVPCLQDVIRLLRMSVRTTTLPICIIRKICSKCLKNKDIRRH